MELVELQRALHEVRDSAAFKRWFSNSKVVNERGEPLVVYHGTAQEFSQFKHEKPVNDDGFLGRGFYFHSDPKQASQYALMASDERYPDSPGRDARVIPVYLSIQKPFRPKWGGSDWLEKGTEGIEREHIITWTDDKIERGYDGVTNGYGEWVAFFPNQVKSAIGNMGSYDSSKDIIHEQN